MRRALFTLAAILGFASCAFAQSTFPGRLPVGCSNGQYTTYQTATGVWVCTSGGGGGGDVTASGTLTNNTLILGGGTTVVKSTTTGTGVLTALGVNIGSAGAPVLFNGAGGTPSSLTLTNATGLPLTTGVTGTLAATNGGTGLTAFTRSGNTTVFGTTSGTLTSGDCVEFDASGNLVASGAACGAGGGDVVASGTLTDNSIALGAGSTSVKVTTTGTGVVTALGVNTGSAGAFVVNGGALGTPSSGTLTSATGLPISTGLTGAGTGVLTALGVNVGSAGAFVTFNGAGGTPSSITLTNATGFPYATGGTGDLPFANLTQCATETVLANTGAGTADVACVAYATLLADMGVKSFTDPGADCVIEFDDSGDVFECVEAATALATVNLITGAVDWGGISSFEIPNAAAPTVDAFGEIAGDNNLWAASRGTAIFFDGTAATAFVNVLVSDTPSNGQVPKWNTGGTITWENDSTGSGLGVNLTSSTNDLTTDNNAIQFIGNSEDLVFTASANTWTLSTTTGVTTIGLSSFVLTFGDNIRQTFNPGANAAGLNVGAQTADPDTPSNGDIFYDSDDHFLRARINGAWVNLGAAGSGCTVAAGDNQIVYVISSACSQEAAFTYDPSTNLLQADAMNFGSAGVKVTQDGDGAWTWLGLGNGTPEDLTWNFDDTANTVDVTTSTGVTALRLNSIGYTVKGGTNGFNMSTDSGGTVTHTFTTYSSALATDKQAISLRRSAGTEASPSDISGGDTLGRWLFSGRVNGAFRDLIQFEGSTSGAASGNNINADFFLTQNNGSGVAVRQIWRGDGSYELGSGSAHIKFSQDGDGQLTLLFNGDGSDENLIINGDDTSNTLAWSSSTGVTLYTFASISLQPAGYNAADGSAGGTGTTCTAFEQGICTAATEPEEFISFLGLAKQVDVEAMSRRLEDADKKIADLMDRIAALEARLIGAR